MHSARLTDPYRGELQVHIYRIVGSAQDAEDLLQETLLAAWRGLAAFEGRASVRAWLYRIATNHALDALRATRRRPEGLQPMTEMPEPTRYGEAIWLEPFPDVLLEGIPDPAPSPEARYEAKEAIELGLSSAGNTCLRSSAPSSCLRRARLPRRRGRRDARHHRTIGQQPAAPRPRGIRFAAARRRTRTGAASDIPNASATPSAASPTRSKQAASRASSRC